MWSNLSILQPHYSIITRLINPLNCTLPPSDMHQCESDYVWPLLQYSPATIKTSPCGHSSPSFLSSSQSHYNYHPPYSISFSVFFIALFSTVETFGIYLLSPPSSASSSPLLSSLLPPPCLIRTSTLRQGTAAGAWEQRFVHFGLINTQCPASQPPPVASKWSTWLTNKPVIEKKKKKKWHTRGLNGCRSYCW